MVDRPRVPGREGSAMPRLATAGAALTAALLCTGCDQEDAQRLARVGQLLGRRAAAFSVSPPRAFNPALAATADGLAERVRQRLRHDKFLTATPVTVEAVGPDVVRLSGDVRKTDLRQRAVQLANSTVGVARV